MENQQIFAVRPLYPNRISYVDTKTSEFIPTIVSQGLGIETNRCIFGLNFNDPNMMYSEFELKMVEELDKLWEDPNDPIVRANLEETQKVRFLQGCHWDIYSAKNAISDYVSWYMKHAPLEPKQAPDRNAPETWLYFYGRDKCMRPILIIDCSRLQLLKEKYNSSTFAQGCLLEVMAFFVSSLTLPGKVEQIVVIADLEGCFFWSVPWDEFNSCIQTLTSKFRGRLSQLIFLHTPLVFYSVWQIAKPLIPERTAAKVKIYRFDYKDELLNSIEFDEIDPVISNRF